MNGVSFPSALYQSHLVSLSSEPALFLNAEYLEVLDFKFNNFIMLNNINLYPESQLHD